MTLTPDLALHGARALRWYQFSRQTADIPLNRDAAIYKLWVDHPELGPPLAPEIPANDGSVYQAFWGWRGPVGARHWR